MTETGENGGSGESEEHYLNGEANPWWQVEFRGPQYVSKITFVNRAGHCASRLFEHSTDCQWEYSNLTFEGPSEGARFGVAHTACNGDACPGTICRHLTNP